MTAWSDPSALTPTVWMVAGQFLVYALGWVGCGLLLRNSGRGEGLGYWAAFMFFVGLGFWLVSQRGDPRTWHAFVGSNIAFAASAACLWRGLSLFGDVRGLGREQAATFALLVVLLTAAGASLENAPARVMISYGGQAWLIGRAAWTVYPALAPEFGRRVAWIMAGLAGCIVAVLSALVLAQWQAWPRAMELHRFDTMNPASMLAYVVLAAVFNFVFMGLVTTRLLRQLREQSLRDALTGLHNRRALAERLRGLWSLRQRGQMDFAVAVIDLDHFKRINDRHGHHGGDEVLVQAAQRLREAAREGDIVARFGGEEFVVLMPGSGRAGALAAAQRLHASISAAPFEVAGQPLRVTASVGLSDVEAGDVDAEACIRRADEALYEAKAAGRNRVVEAGASGSAAGTSAHAGTTTSRAGLTSSAPSNAA